MGKHYPVIMVFIDWYHPAYKAGGPIVAAVNFARQMSAHYQVNIFTGDRDLGELQPLEGITRDSWIHSSDNLRIFYASERSLGIKEIRKQIALVQPEYIYLNGLFSKNFTLYPLLLHRFAGIKARMILSPRGMLKASALDQKKFKKTVFLGAFKLLGLHRGVIFHATDATEKEDIRREFGSDSKIFLVPDFAGFKESQAAPVEKHAGQLNMIFIGRIHPIKNLLYLLDCLRNTKSEFRLTIVGNVEDENYWNDCCRQIATLPPNIAVEMRYDLPHHELLKVLALHHVSILPTKGENFGHAIFESLSEGKPAIVSDQTPWRHLQAGRAGWDLPLNQPVLFAQAMEEAAGWGQETYNEWSFGAWNRARLFIQEADLISNYKKLFS